VKKAVARGNEPTTKVETPRSTKLAPAASASASLLQTSIIGGKRDPDWDCAGCGYTNFSYRDTWYTHAHTNAHTHTNTHACAHMRFHKHRNTHERKHIHTHTYTHVHKEIESYR
jgi:hypothetical protein